MRTLTIPAAVSKRKEACKNCRQRKKKCNAEHPRCSSCKRIGIICEYTATSTGFNGEDVLNNSSPEVQMPTTTSSSSTSLNLDQPPGSLDFIQSPRLFFDSFMPNLDQNPVGPWIYLTPESTIETSEQADLLKEFQLPSHEVLLELVDLFFDNLYHMFPCFHRRSFMLQVESGVLQKDSPIILYAICCVTARYHPDKSIQKRHREWYEQAKFYYDVTHRHPEPALRTMQAALLLILQAFTVGDFSSSWLVVGKAWRQAVALDLNKMDVSNINTGFGETPGGDVAGEGTSWVENSKPRNAVEREEYRRTLWLMFIMDRGHSWPTGWPNAISETHFKVNIPIADEIFQKMDPNTNNRIYTNITFTRSLKHLIAAPSEPLNVFRYIIVANILLGRVSELVHSLHDAPDSPEYIEQCEELDAHLVKLRLSIPHQATSILAARAADRAHVTWLQINLNCIAMLLHYRQATDADTDKAGAPAQIILAVTAARNVAQIVRDASRISIDLLLSPHLAASMYIAACILVIEWRLTNDQSFKEEIGLFELVFDRMNDVFVFLGLKFKLALDHDMMRSEATVTFLRTQGFRGLLVDCSKWSHVKNEVQRRRLPIDIP